MRILIDIGHPAHVHYFKNLIRRLEHEGHQFLVTARDKEMAHLLLDEAGIPFLSRGPGSDLALGKILYLIRTDLWMYRIARRFKPHLFLSFGSPYAAHVSKWLKAGNIIFDDTENARFGQAFYRPFTRWVFSPRSFKPSFDRYHFKFDSYMELCYLHPNHFKPDPDIRTELGVGPGEKFVIVRFVSWQANHDMGHSGITLANKIKAVEAFTQLGRVFISSEGQLPEELEQYRFPLSPVKMHDVLATADLFFGESATMASESAVLGTRAVYLDDVGRGYTSEQEERFGTVYNFTESTQDQILAIKKGVELLRMDWSDLDRQRVQSHIVGEKLNLTSFMTWLVDNYPGSAYALLSNPELQYRFR